MTANKRNMDRSLAKSDDPYAQIGSDLAKVDAHVIQPEEYEEAPELTDEDFERADLYHGDKLVRPGKDGPNPFVAQAIRQTAGRPRLANPKQAIKLRLDPDVLAFFRSTGPGWQTRINAILRKAAKLKKAG